MGFCVFSYNVCSLVTTFFSFFYFNHLHSTQATAPSTTAPATPAPVAEQQQHSYQVGAHLHGVLCGFLCPWAVLALRPLLDVERAQGSYQNADAQKPLISSGGTEPF